MPNPKQTLTGLGYGEDEVFYVGTSTAAIYGTWGGIQVDDGYHVLNNSNEAVPGLYAIGNVIGGAGNVAGMMSPIASLTASWLMARIECNANTVDSLPI